MQMGPETLAENENPKDCAGQPDDYPLKILTKI
jgi:hypothetical protein